MKFKLDASCSEECTSVVEHPEYDEDLWPPYMRLEDAEIRAKALSVDFPDAHPVKAPYNGPDMYRVGYTHVWREYYIELDSLEEVVSFIRKHEVRLAIRDDDPVLEYDE